MTKDRLRWTIVVFVAEACLVFCAPRPVAGPSPISDALDRYARGQFDVAAALVTKLEKDKNPTVGLAQQLEHDGPLWIDAMGPLAAPKRRLIAATFALEMARAAHGWTFTERMLAWGCARLRDDPHPQAVERSWYLASVGVSEEHGTSMIVASESRMGDGTIALLGTSWPRAPRTAPAVTAPPDYVHAPNALDESAGELAEGHLAHAIARFPDVPEFQLAKARAIIAGSWGAGKVGVPVDEQSRAFPGDITQAYLARLVAAPQPAAPSPSSSDLGMARRPSGSVDVFNLADLAYSSVHAPLVDEPLRIKELRGALTILEHLTNPGPMLADVHLYYGIIALRFGERAAALQHFGQVEQLTTDPLRRCNARVLEGIAHERLQEWDAAAASYRSALDAVPHARTAATMLTAVLLVRGHTADAEVFADDVLSVPMAPDPWNRLLMADPASFAGYFDQLRKALQ